MTSNTTDQTMIPASAIQKQFWFIQQMAPETSAYNIAAAFNLHGLLNLKALEKSVQAIIERHSIFRTCLSYVSGEVWQCIVSEMPFSARVINLNDGDTVWAGVLAMLHEEAAKPFDLSRWPLIRLQVIRRRSNLHTILFVMHHCIFDLETKKMFARELADHYSVFSTGDDGPTNLPKEQYSDYAQWQRQWLKSPEALSQAQYWGKTLKGISGLLQLPADYNRPIVQSLEGRAHKIQFDQDMTKKIDAFSNKNSVKPFLVLLTSFIVLLYRYSNQKDIVVGVPLTNRRDADHKEIMGCLINVIPLAVEVSSQQSFKDLLRKVRLGMLGGHRNQECPLEVILNTVQIPRNMSHNPLFQVGFTFEPQMPLFLEGLEVEPVRVHHGGAQLDILAVFWETSHDSIEGYFEYNSSIFKDWRIEQFSENFNTLLNAALLDGEQEIGSLNILSKDAKLRMMEWNNTEQDLGAPDSVHRWFEAQAAKTPDSMAVVYENSELTYSELDFRAGQVAAYLQKLGVMPETLVGLYIDRGPDMVVALLGILKAGGAYVPLDPDFPKERIAYMLDHSAAGLVITTSALANDLPDVNAKAICIDAQWEEIVKQSPAGVKVAVGAENTAYVIYTSGSTGKPKGVQISHGALVNFLASMAQQPGVDSSDVLLSVTTLSFDISILEIFLPLVTGGKTVIVSRTVASDGKLLREAMQISGATILQATPTTWRLLFAGGWSAPAGFKALCGGEPLPVDLAHRFIEQAGGVWNMYGPTETTIWSTCYYITDKRQPIAIGKPIGNTQTYLLDSYMNPVPQGVRGELYIGGAGVAKGYLNAPELTKERFLADPFSKVPNARMYKTGDWCRYLEDGNLEFDSRIDNQVKVHGFRIELGEVESMLNQHPQVRESAAVVQEAANGNKRLIGYIVPQDDPPSNEALREFMLEHLPHYMVPSLFIKIERMPLTPNAKIDRKALPLPDTTRPELEEVFVAPADGPEEKMAAIWRDILNIDRIGVHDNFFVLGGDSLLSVQLIARIQEEFKTDIRVAKLFQFPTLRSLLKILNQQASKPGMADFSERANLRKQAYARRQAKP